MTAVPDIPASAPTTPSPDVDPGLRTFYAGRKSPMFRLALKTGVLTIVTLGFYRFWMKTRMRRYYWSALRPGGVPMEFTGRGSEMMLGFFTAVVILAFYIGVVNLLLMFASYALAGDDLSAYALSFLGLAPMIFFAQYRARRYILARTRWRGIRFGLEPGVKGYVWRAALHWLITILTLGLLWPRMTFALEKYRTDRMWFGDAKFEQTGRWTELLGAMKHVYIGVAIIAVSSLGAALTDDPMWLPFAVPGALWAAIGLAYWKAQSFKRLTERKRLGDIGFVASPSTGTLIGIYLGGSTAMGAILVVLMIVVFAIFALIGSIVAPGLFDETSEMTDLATLPTWVLTATGLVSYFSVFLFWGVLREVFLTLPIVRHFAETTTLTNPDALGHIRQRARDDFAEAEGFADALPLGGGF